MRSQQSGARDIACSCGYMLRLFGRVADTEQVLAKGYGHASATADQKRQGWSAEQAALANLRGELDKALALYEQSLQIKEQLGDLKGKSATLRHRERVGDARAVGQSHGPL